jgi:D-sedoheptulose 7-phosphate isomerase
MNDQIKMQVADAVETHKRMVAEFESRSLETVATIAQMVIDVFRRGGTVYLCGNGGSAADAQHIAWEFVGRFHRQRKSLPAVAFSTDTSVLTCIANDYAYDRVFARQAEALVREGDVLWAFSTSGTSANVVAAAKVARDKGARVIAFTGRPDSELEQIANICLCAEDESTARSQEIHQLAYHIICDLVDVNFTND